MKAEVQKHLKSLLKIKRLWLLLLFPIARLLIHIAEHSIYFAEELYAKGFFKVYSQVFSLITGIFPFSIAEFGILIGIVLVPTILIAWIVRLIKQKENRRKRVLTGVLTVAAVFCVVYFMLVLGCGLNYYRQPFTYYTGTEIRDSSEDELYALCSELIQRTNTVRAQLITEDENGVFKLDFSMRELAKRSQKAFSELSKEYPIFSGYYPKTKSVLFSKFMSRMNMTGMFVPYTMEANVNINVSHYSIASTMCHELAHLRGFIREDEANYISYLVCTQSDDLVLQYSGLMEALILSGNKLYDRNPDRYFELRSLYLDGVNRDLAANSEYWIQFEDTVISKTATTFNDTYLKANNQEDGVQSYGRMVDLLLAEYRKNHALD